MHDGGRFGGAKGNWYRNYKLRELTDEGRPPSVSTRRTGAAAGGFGLRATAATLIGTIDAEHAITVRDLRGRVLETFRGQAGKVSYTFTSKTFGLLLLDVKTAKGITHQQVSRI